MVDPSDDEKEREAARAKAQAELEAMGEVDFRPRRMPKWQIAAAIVVAGIVGAVAYRASRPPPRPSIDRGTGTRAKGEEGCPCGCDRSARMSAELRNAPEGAPKAIEKSLVTIAEREDVGYVTERMVQHRLRLLGVAEDLKVEPPPSRVSVARDRCAGGSVHDGALRVCPELVVHGERIEIVEGKEKLIESCFKLWLEIENLTGEARTLSPASIEGGAVHFPVSRWYEEGGAGQAWDGVVGAKQKVRVNVIGYIPEHVVPGTAIDARIALGTLAMRATTTARAVIHLRERVTP